MSDWNASVARLKSALLLVNEKNSRLTAAAIGRQLEKILSGVSSPNQIASAINQVRDETLSLLSMLHRGGDVGRARQAALTSVEYLETVLMLLDLSKTSKGIQAPALERQRGGRSA